MLSARVDLFFWFWQRAACESYAEAPGTQPPAQQHLPESAAACGSRCPRGAVSHGAAPAGTAAQGNRARCEMKVSCCAHRKRERSYHKEGEESPLIWCKDVVFLGRQGLVYRRKISVVRAGSSCSISVRLGCSLYESDSF